MIYKIEAIEIQHYRLPLDPPFYASWDARPRTNHAATIVRVLAGGYEGVGSGDAMLGFQGLEELFIGQDPFSIERHVQVLDSLQFHYGRMWPLEVALWDLMGQISEQPLWKLLGGRSKKIRLYASTGELKGAKERAESAVWLKEMGFPALKIRMHSPDPRADISVIQGVRQAVGSDMALLVDANQGWQMPGDESQPWDFETALWVAQALDELDVYWLEEPLHRHEYEGLASLRQEVRVRIAGGEGNREFASLREYLHHGSLDVYQPDVVWSTGILRARQLASEVQEAGAIYSPHTWGDGLALLANLHVAAAVSRAPFIEYPFDPPGWTPERRDFILPAPIKAENGYVTLPDGPGLGVKIDWKQLEKFEI